MMNTIDANGDFVFKISLIDKIGPAAISMNDIIKKWNLKFDRVPSIIFSDNSSFSCLLIFDITFNRLYAT